MEEISQPIIFVFVCISIFYIAIKMETKRHNKKMDKIVNDTIKKLKREQSTNNNSNS